jgi:transposase
MIDKRVVFEIHRLAHEGWSKNRIAGQLALDRATVAKYLDNPNPERKKIIRPSLLDPFREQIREMLETHPHVSAAVIRQRLAEKGYTGGSSILRAYVHDIRPQKRRPFLRFETAPGEHYGKQEIMLRSIYPAVFRSGS